MAVGFYMIMSMKCSVHTNQLFLITPAIFTHKGLFCVNTALRECKNKHTLTMLSTHQEQQTHSRTMLWIKMRTQHTKNTNTLSHNVPAVHKKAWITSHTLSSSTISQNAYRSQRHEDQNRARSTATHFLAMPNSHKPNL